MPLTTGGIEILEKNAIVAPGLSPAAKSRIYFSSTDSVERISQNAAAYVPVIEQTGFAEQAVDTSTVSIVFVDLLTVAITARGGTRLEILATFSASIAVLAGQGLFRLLLDAGALRGAGFPLATLDQPNSGAIVQRSVVVAAGVRTVKLQWRTTVGSTLQVRPVAAPNDEHAALFVKELSG